ncbi:Flp pilus assembly protein CpaB [Pseudomonadota bacterium]
MRVVIIGLIFAAVILAGGTAYLLRDYLSAQQAEIASQAPKAPTSSVMVAATDMPAGTVLNSNNIEWVPWPEDKVPDDYLEKTPDVDPLQDIEKDRHVVRRAMLKGEPVTMAKLYKSDSPGFLPGTLAPGMRAIAVRTSAVSAAAGFIMPGDRVDIMLSHTMVQNAMDQAGDTAGSNIVAFQFTSETIFKDLRVLAIDQRTNEFEGAAVVGKTVLLEVTPKQAEQINTAKSMGNLSLILRSAETGEPEYGRGFSTDIEVSPMLSRFDALLSGGDGGFVGVKNQPAAVPTPSAAPMPRSTPAPRYQPPAKEIKIYRGGQDGSAAK